MSSKKKIKMLIELECVAYPEAYTELLESVSGFKGLVKEMTVAFPVFSSEFDKEIKITNSGRVKRFEAMDDWETVWESEN